MLLSGVALLVVAACAPVGGERQSRVTTEAPNGDVATVVEVTDGDTLRVDYGDRHGVTVRLIGINAPESDECFGVEATAGLASLVEGVEVSMVRDVSERDRFGRLLRFLYLADGTFVNESVVQQGFALAREYPPDTTMTAVLEVAQAAAETEEAGLWAPDACGDPAGAVLRITDLAYDAPGNDADNLNGEWVEITNTGAGLLDLMGWTLKDESASHRYAFPSDFSLRSAAVVRIYTGCGSDTGTELYWCNTAGAVWNNSGDTAFLLDPEGNIHDHFSY